MIYSLAYLSSLRNICVWIFTIRAQYIQDLAVKPTIETSIINHQNKLQAMQIVGSRILGSIKSVFGHSCIHHIARLMCRRMTTCQSLLFIHIDSKGLSKEKNASADDFFASTWPSALIRSHCLALMLMCSLMPHYELHSMSLYYVYFPSYIRNIKFL